MKQPEFTRDQLLACVPLALFHAFTNTLMLTSLSKIAVSLTHTIRATEPLFVTLAAMFVLGTRPRASLIWSLVPIVVGVSVASATDVSFSWIGFLAAMGSNVASTMRNVYSKQARAISHPQPLAPISVVNRCPSQKRNFDPSCGLRLDQEHPTRRCPAQSFPVPSDQASKKTLWNNL